MRQKRRINVRVDAALLDAATELVKVESEAGRCGTGGRWNMTALINQALSDYVTERSGYAEY